MPIKVVIASPSLISRSRMAKLLARCRDFEVIALTADLSETFTISEASEPNVVILTRDLCKVPEFRSMRSQFYALDARWIELETEAGRPGPGLITLQSGRQMQEPMLDLAMTLDAAIEQIRLVLTFDRSYGDRPRMFAAKPATGPERVVLIGASTGGVDALLTLLSGFPADCPPTAIVQHTGKGFSDSLIRLLDRCCGAKVVAPQDGMALKRGTVCVAAGAEGHLRLKPGNLLQCTIRPGPATSGHTPSVDELFRSALPIASNVVAALLTGMGQDGAAGLLELRKAGSVTIGQDAATSAVYGMPKAAWDIGAAQRQLPLQEIAAEILRAAAASRRVATC